MQRVVAIPVTSSRSFDRVLWIGGILLALIIILGGGYWLWMHGTAITQAIATASRWLPFQLDPTWILVGLLYGLVARALLTLGILAALNKKRTLVATQLG